MKKMVILALVLLALIFGPQFLFAQQNSADAAAPHKFALVIGNSNYTGLTALANPVNDANDIAAVLQHLGFTVDKVLNGTLEQMEDASMRLRDSLSNADDAYGFFFYAGHGVQSGGENYLIPVNANIPSENALRNRAMSVQMLLDDLNDAGNSLNVVVLDACRDNPFGWSRSGTRGLSIVTRQPADSIIVYATSAGQRASDGDGRNGLFTSQLINNLATPGLEVAEVFKRTGNDVAQASKNQQVPAIYSQFFGTAFLGDTPVDFEGYVRLPGTTVIIGGREKEPEPAKFWSVGASVGSSFAAPWLIGTIHGTIAPFRFSFLELGLDAGFFSGDKDVSYYALCPFIHYAFFWPMMDKIHLYAGAGAGYYIANYNYSEEGEISGKLFTADATAGFVFFDMLIVNYTLRTDFATVSNKLSVGYVYRF